MDKYQQNIINHDQNLLLKSSSTIEKNNNRRINTKNKTLIKKRSKRRTKKTPKIHKKQPKRPPPATPTTRSRRSRRSIDTHGREIQVRLARLWSRCSLLDTKVPLWSTLVSSGLATLPLAQLFGLVMPFFTDHIFRSVIWLVFHGWYKRGLFR